MTDLAGAVKALADLGIHPVGLTVDGSVLALRLSLQDQSTVLKDTNAREAIVERLRKLGFLYVTLHLDEKQEEVYEEETAVDFSGSPDHGFSSNDSGGRGGGYQGTEGNQV